MRTVGSEAKHMYRWALVHPNGDNEYFLTREAIGKQYPLLNYHRLKKTRGDLSKARGTPKDLKRLRVIQVNKPRYDSERVDCRCGGHYYNTPQRKKDHFKSKRHQRYIFDNICCEH